VEEEKLTVNIAEADESRMDRTYRGHRWASILSLGWLFGDGIEAPRFPIGTWRRMPQRPGERNAKEECPGRRPGASVALPADGVWLPTVAGGAMEVDKTDVDKAEGKGAPAVNSARCAWCRNLIGGEVERCLTWMTSLRTQARCSRSSQRIVFRWECIVYVQIVSYSRWSWNPPMKPALLPSNVPR